MAGSFQFETGRLQRWVAAACLLLVLTFAGVEAAHIHLGPGIARESASCLVCISVHANAPAVTAYFLPVVMAVEMIVVPCETSATGIAARLELFTRPPPYLI